jgi:hypothetical protein
MKGNWVEGVFSKGNLSNDKHLRKENGKFMNGVKSLKINQY